MPTLICLALLATTPAQGGRIPIPLADIPSVAEGRLMDGHFLLKWDDKVDGKVESGGLECMFRLENHGSDFLGEFTEGLPGENRTALMAGTMEYFPGKSSTVRFWQVERGYTCTYTLVLRNGPLVGVWHDSKGRHGDFHIQRYQ